MRSSKVLCSRSPLVAATAGLGVLALWAAAATGAGSGAQRAGSAAAPAPAALTITGERHHLGDQRLPDWPVPEAEGLERSWTFEAPAHAAALTLAIDQQDVHRRWDVVLNGRSVGALAVRTPRATEYVELPAGLLRAGENTLTVTLAERPAAPDGNADDVLVGPIVLHCATFRELFRLRPVRVAVQERGTGRALPARLTVVRVGREDELDVPLHYVHPASAAAEGHAPSERTPARPSILYCAPEPIAFEAPVGEYAIYASRGVEWSRARQTFALTDAGESEPLLVLELERELETEGWIACDTHLHTYTFSGHGDATLAERVVSLVAEGVELAIATDHNHRTDYAPTQQRLGLEAWTTAVVGNEVTTRNGHFNAFPFTAPGSEAEAQDDLPDHTLSDWVALVDDIRAHGASVVVLNHPRWPRVDDCPLALFEYEPETGRRLHRASPAFTFDALELVNATCDTPDPYLLLRDWLGLLNGGERVFAVGSSDSHTVGDPAGQGRTYVAGEDDDPARIDVEAACAAIAAGRTSVSLGLVATAEARDPRSDRPGDGWRGMGETVAVPVTSPAGEGDALAVRLRVQAPSWARAREVRVFVNGIEVLTRRLEAADLGSGATDVTLALEVPLPAHDAHVVCAVAGEEVAEPFWHSLNAYTFAATNPIFVDRDGDGAWRSPRGVAEQALAALRGTSDRSAASQALVARVDAAVAAQLVALVAGDAELERELVAAVAARHPALGAWIARRAAQPPSASPK